MGTRRASYGSRIPSRSSGYCKMKRSIKTMIYIVLFSLLANAPLFSFAASVHDGHMAKVLFGNRAGVHKRSEKIKALEYASYLAIDQFNGKGEEKLSYLRDKTKVRGLPARISAFEFLLLFWS
jgi:hypothetical protein